MHSSMHYETFYDEDRKKNHRLIKDRTKFLIISFFSG